VRLVPAIQAGMGWRRRLGGGVAPTAETPKRGRRKPRCVWFRLSGPVWGRGGTREEEGACR